MALAERLRSKLERARRIAGKLKLRPYQVFLVYESWTGTHTGDGDATTIRIELTEKGNPPKVRLVDDQQRALAELADGSIEVGPVTPKHGQGGFDLSKLTGVELGKGETLKVETVGPRGKRRYVVSKIFDDSALHYRLQAEPVAGGDC